MINDNFLCLQVFYLHAHVCTVYMLDACRSQKKALDPLELELQDSCRLPHKCWEPNSGVLKDQKVFLTYKSLLHPCALLHFINTKWLLCLISNVESSQRKKVCATLAIVSYPSLLPSFQVHWKWRHILSFHNFRHKGLKFLEKYKHMLRVCFGFFTWFP